MVVVELVQAISVAKQLVSLNDYYNVVVEDSKKGNKLFFSRQEKAGFWANIGTIFPTVSIMISEKNFVLDIDFDLFNDDEEKSSSKYLFHKEWNAKDYTRNRYNNSEIGEFKEAVDRFMNESFQLILKTENN